MGDSSVTIENGVKWGKFVSLNTIDITESTKSFSQVKKFNFKNQVAWGFGIILKVLISCQK